MGRSDKELPVNRMRLFVSAGAVLLAMFAVSARAFGQNIPMIDPTKAKPQEVKGKDEKMAPIGTIEVVDGKSGKAAKLTFPSGTGLFTNPLKATPDWDQTDGFSFWVKGDGSDSLGGIELMDDTYALRYAYAFPIDSTEWKKITVRWSDLAPELTGPFVDPAKGTAPSKFVAMSLGKWFYWRDYPAYSYTIENVVLEKKLPPADTTDYTATSTGLAQIAQKIKAKKPITIVTMGDSLTDTKHNSNTKIAWPQMLADKLKEVGVDAKVINPAAGGTTLSQNIVTMPRWEKLAPNPDLVIINFGGNDFDTKVTGAMFKNNLEHAVDRIRRDTKGSADILIVTTCPGFKRWDTYKDLEQAGRDVAAEKKVGLVDLATEARKLGTAEETLKMNFWHWDNVHLGQKGKDMFRDLVFQAIQNGK